MLTKLSAKKFVIDPEIHVPNLRLGKSYLGHISNDRENYVPSLSLMSTARYQRIPTENSSHTSIALKSRSMSTSCLTTNALDTSERGRHPATATYNNDLDRRFHEPTPSIYARIGLLIFVVGMLIVAFMMRVEIWREIVGQEENRIREESERWAEWAAAQV